MTCRSSGTVVLCLQLLRTPDTATALRISRAMASPPTPTRSPPSCLEKQEFLISEWNTDESRPRKFYRTS